MWQKLTAALNVVTNSHKGIRVGFVPKMRGDRPDRERATRFIGRGTIYSTRLNAYFIALVDGTGRARSVSTSTGVPSSAFSIPSIPSTVLHAVHRPRFFQGVFARATLRKHTPTTHERASARRAEFIGA